MKKFDELYNKIIKKSIIKESEDSAEKVAKIVEKLTNGNYNSLVDLKADDALLDEFKQSDAEDKKQILEKFYENIESLDEKLNEEKIKNLTLIHTFLKELI